MHTQRVSEKTASILLLENVRTAKSYVSQVWAVIITPTQEGTEKSLSIPAVSSVRMKAAVATCFYSKSSAEAQQAMYLVEDGAGEAAELEESWTQSSQPSANPDLALTADPVLHFPPDAQTGSESHSKPSVIASLGEPLRLAF